MITVPQREALHFHHQALIQSIATVFFVIMKINHAYCHYSTIASLCRIKARISKKITDAFVETYQLPPEAIQIFFSETSHENWAKGGYLAIDKK